MATNSSFDAVVVGAGPNGLAAAITLARAGLSVQLIEAQSIVGGGTHTIELTLPGFYHDVCASVLATALVSPFMRSLPLEQHGVTWVQPDIPVSHPLDGGSAAVVHRSLEETADGLGTDGKAYRRLFKPLLRDWQKIMGEILGPLPLPPRHIPALANFGRWAIQPASTLARHNFRTAAARALFAGMGGHSILPLHWPGTSAFGIVMTLGAHGVGWPVVRGGTQRFADALASIFAAYGGQIILDQRVDSIKQLPPARAVLFDVTPRNFIKIAGDSLPDSYRRSLGRFRYGAGVCKVDYALSGPIPWQDPSCARSGTLHLGGTLEEIETAEAQVGLGEHPEKPYVLLVQPSVFDPTRAPIGKHTAWAYCHVPNGSTLDVSGRIEAQIERFAPGFRDLVLERHVFTATQMESYNSNYVGGDINSGMQDLSQLFTRPVPRRLPYATPLKGVYLCSSSTPPGGGVHGMSGYQAAKAALWREFHLKPELSK
jgi:phytoene dehydrogenase-like protein